MRLITIKRIAFLGLLLSFQMFIVKPLMANGTGVLDVMIEVTDMSGVANDNIVCMGDQVMLRAIVQGSAVGLTYSWDDNMNSSSQMIEVGAGTYRVAVTDANGCTATDIVEITGSNGPDVMIEVTDMSGVANDNIVCMGDQVMLRAIVQGSAVGLTYSWDDNMNSSSQMIEVGAGTYRVAVTDANGCTATDIVEITGSNGPNVSIAVSDDSGIPNNNRVCGEATATLTAIGGNSYEWSPSDLPNNEVIMVGAGDYSVTATDSFGCTGSSEMTSIFSDPLPNANFTFNPQNDIPVETEITFTANDNTFDTYSWNFGSEINCFTINNGENTPIIKMQFNCDDNQMATLTVTDNDTGCTNSSSQEVDIESGRLDVDIINFPELLCVGTTITPEVEFKETSGNGIKDERWEVIDGPIGISIDNITDDATKLSPEFQFNTVGAYTLKLSVTQNITNEPEVEEKFIDFTVTPNPSQDSYLSLPNNDSIICQGEKLKIEIKLEDGDFPPYIFRIKEINPDQNEDTNGIEVNDNSSTISAETDQVGTYEFSITSIEDRNGCRVDNLNQSSITYEVVSIPTIQDVDDSCDSETEFIVSFEIEDGVPPFNITQTIDDIPSLISENTNNFESNPLPLLDNGTEWEYMVEDSNGCQSDSKNGIKTVDDCSGLCFSFSNSIEPDLSDLMLCDNENIEVSIDLTNNGVELRDGQALRFVLINDISQDEMAFSPFMMRNTDNIYNHTFNNLTSGTYFIQVEAGSFNADMMAFTADCSIVTEDSGPFEVFPFPDIESITVNTMCAGDRETEINIALFDAQPIGNYTIFFNNNGGQELTNNNTTIEIETPEDDISYPIDSLVYEINGHRCTSENTDLTVNALDVDVFPLPVINDILINDMSQNGEIGVGEDVKFKATIFDSNPIVDYSWVFDGGDTISTNTIDMIENNFGNPGTVNLDLIVTDENGCTSIFPLEFEVKGGLDCDGMILLPANELSVCFGTLLTISSNEIEVDSNQTVNYLWSVNNILQNGNNDNEFEYSPETNPESGIISNTISVSYTITQGSSLVCESNTDDFLVSVKATPEFEENAFKAFNESPCLNQFTTYILDMKNVADKYEWSVNEINNTTDMPIANIGWNTEGVFELGVVAQNENGCDAEKTIEVVVNNTEAPPYHELFTITRNDTESVIVAYPDSTYCYEWHSSENQEDFINNFNNSDITFSNLEEDQRQFKVFNTSADISEFTWIKVYGDGSNCNGSLNDDCSTNIFYSDSVLTFFAARFTNPDNDNPEIILYPNPNNGQFVIEFQGEFQETVYQLSVYDSRGASLFNKTMVEDDISQSKYQIQLKDLVSGLYYLRITSKNGLDQTKKFVIQK